MADLHDVVANAVSEATESGKITASPDYEDSGSEVPAGDSGDGGDTGVVAEVSPSEEGATPTVKATPAELDEIDKELESHGIKRVGRNGQENRIPYKNLKKTWENKSRKLTEEHTRALGEHTQKIQHYEGELGAYRQSDELLRRDPDRFMELLSTINPAFRAWQKAGGGQQQVEREAVPVSKAGPKPEPDAAFPDGSKGYSPEQHEKLMEWHEARAEERAYARAKKDFDERFGPIEKDWKTTQHVNKLAPIVEGQMGQMSKMWGRLFDEEVKKGNGSEILRYMKTYGVSLEHATSAVLLPRMNKSQDEIRAQVVAEMQKRPAAAQQTAGQQSVRKSEDGPRTIADAVRESVAAAGLR